MVQAIAVLPLSFPTLVITRSAQPLLCWDRYNVRMQCNAMQHRVKQADVMNKSKGPEKGSLSA